MSGNEIQLKQTQIREREKTNRKKIEEAIWSKRIILMIVASVAVVISVGFVTGFGR